MSQVSGPPSPFFDLLHLDIRYPIATRIYHYLPIQDILSVSQTCTSLRNVYRSLLPLEWNVDRTLSRFVSNPREFRAQMAKCNALIGGSVPLQFFERLIWKDEPLLILQPESSRHMSLVTYLEDVEGYESTPTAIERVEMTSDGSLARQALTKRDGGQSLTGPMITIRFTLGPLILDIINDTASTVFANCFSWNRAYSIHPLITSIRHHAFVHRDLQNRILERLVCDFENKGWKFPSPLGPDSTNEEVTTYPLRLTRRVGDCYTWSIPFDNEGVDGSESLPDYVLEYAAFSATPIANAPVEGEHPLKYYNFSAKEFKNPVLKYVYTVGLDGWYSWLKKVLMYKTLEELHKLEPASRPETFEIMVSDTQNIEYLMRDFDQPECWTHCDAEIPKLYEEWKTALCYPGR